MATTRLPKKPMLSNSFLIATENSNSGIGTSKTPNHIKVLNILNFLEKAKGSIDGNAKMNAVEAISWEAGWTTTQE